MGYEEYKRKALEPIVNYIESVMASYSKEELEARIKKALPEKESEDDKIRKDIINYIGFEKPIADKDENRIKEMIAYLEKRKEQKPAEWSEEEKKKIANIMMVLMVSPIEYAEEIEFIKSLCPQPNWKPSEEQMNHLCAIVNEAKRKHNISVSGYPTARILESLYNDLKKLM